MVKAGLTRLLSLVLLSMGELYGLSTAFRRSTLSSTQSAGSSYRKSCPSTPGLVVW